MSERLLQFGPEGGLSGVLREPASDADAPGVLFFNAGVIHRIGPHRLNVKMARAIDASSLRFDLSGQGESPPAPPGLNFEQQAGADLSAAIDAMQGETGARDIAIVGVCSGADHALRAALDDKRVTALLLIDPYAYANDAAASADFLARAGDPDRWRRWLTALMTRQEGPTLQRSKGAPEARDHQALDQGRPVAPKDSFGANLSELIARSVRIQIVYSGLVRRYVSKPAHFFQTFAGYDFEGNIDVATMSEADHIFTAVSAQASLIALLQDWLAPPATCLAAKAAS